MLPLFNARHAVLHNEVPGITIPEGIRQRMRSAGEKGAQEGVGLAEELISNCVHWYRASTSHTAFERYDLAAEVIEAVAA
ncbi:MAG: hypothetical protein U0401_03800 [Anaerolineae bacterium]